MWTTSIDLTPIVLGAAVLAFVCWRFPRLYRVLRRVWFVCWFLFALPFRVVGIIARPLSRGAAVRSGRPTVHWGQSWQSDLTRNPWGNPWR